MVEYPVSHPLDCYAIAHPGAEAVTAAELAALGLAPGATEPGGVAFRTDLDGVWRANLELRTAARVLVRVAEFRASAFAELERRADRVPWGDWVAPGAPVRFRVTSRKSRLYHQDAVAERLHGAVARAVPGAHPAPSLSAASSASSSADDAEADAAQLFVVRLLRDRCTVSVDSSGALLHRRGYRLAVAKAPLRETLAAAMLLGAGWDGSAPLVDPFCGSGTIPIEAALLARRIPPGLHRTFAFERWPGFDAARWHAVRDAARAAIRAEASVPILGADRDAGAIRAATSNAERAGVAADVTFRRAPLSALEPPGAAGPPAAVRERAGWLVTNPPYGVRVGERHRVRDLYAQLGHVARRRLPGWHVAFLSTHPELEAQTGLTLAPRWLTSNGGIRVRLVSGTVGALVLQES